MSYFWIAMGCTLGMIAALSVLVVFLIRLRNKKRSELNKKIAIFSGKIVNKKAEGTMGYGLLFAETAYGVTTMVPPGTTQRMLEDSKKQICVVLQNLSTGEMMKRILQGYLDLGRSMQRESSYYLCVSGEGISREHCRLYIKNGVLYVSDLGSVNHTYLNGKQINRDELLRSGDTLKLGMSQFRISIMH